MSVKEVPSDHDFFDPAYVKHWTESISRYRPERKRLFEVFAAEAARIKKGALSVLELGCGPGFLAEALLKNCEIARYTLVDFSPQMLDLSRSRLAKFQDRTVFIRADFKKANWAAGIRADFDLIVSLQAVHELRHASRIPNLYAQLHSLLASRRNHFDLRSRQFFLALRSSSRPFHDGRRAFVDLQESWFHQRKGNLPRRRLEPDGGGEALRKR